MQIDPGAKFQFSGVLRIITALLFVSCKPPSYVALVNGEPIAEKEFRQHLQNNVSGIYSYFYDKYRVEDSKDFWSGTYNGENPLRRIREKALRDCVRIKVQQILARRNGIIDNLGYDAFVWQLSAENQRRRDAVAKNIPVYGPLQFNEKTYFDFFFNNMRVRLREKLATQELKVSEEAARKYFDENILSYKRKDFVRIKTISARFDSTNETVVGKRMATVLEKNRTWRKFQERPEIEGWFHLIGFFDH